MELSDKKSPEPSPISILLWIAEWLLLVAPLYLLALVLSFVSLGVMVLDPFGNIVIGAGTVVIAHLLAAGALILARWTHRVLLANQRMEALDTREVKIATTSLTILICFYASASFLTFVASGVSSDTIETSLFVCIPIALATRALLLMHLYKIRTEVEPSDA